MSFSLPKEIDYTLKTGDQGVVVWAFQRTCNKLGLPTTESGVFDNTTTLASARGLQAKLHVEVDGLFGPASQRALAEFLVGRVERQENLIDKILLSKVLYESGGYLGAVNYSAPGGVDCGLTQRRVYELEYHTPDRIKEAFDAMYQLDLSAKALKVKYSEFMARRVIRKRETGMRVAILNHNYPALAEAISWSGFKSLSRYWTTEQLWTLQVDPKTGRRYHLTFPDGHKIKTPLEWGQRYALGNAAHNEPGQAVKLVESWDS